MNGQFIGVFPGWVAVPPHEVHFRYSTVPAYIQVNQNRNDPNGYHPPLH